MKGDRRRLEKVLSIRLWRCKRYLPGKASEGHFLVIRYRHFSSHFDINDVELVDLKVLVARGKEIVDEKYHPDGYNIGISIGSCAGNSFTIYMSI